MIAKDFDLWNEEKKKLDSAKQNIFFHEREIWWCSIGLNIGDEQDGKNELFERPVLIIRKFNDRLAWVLPLTTKLKEGKYHHKIVHDDIEFVVILSQLRLVSIKRFHRRIRKIMSVDFNIIKGKITELL